MQQTESCQNLLQSGLLFALNPKIIDLSSRTRSWNGSSLAPLPHATDEESKAGGDEAIVPSHPHGEWEWQNQTFLSTCCQPRTPHHTSSPSLSVIVSSLACALSEVFRVPKILQVLNYPFRDTERLCTGFFFLIHTKFFFPFSKKLLFSSCSLHRNLRVRHHSQLISVTGGPPVCRALGWTLGSHEWTYTVPVSVEPSRGTTRVVGWPAFGWGHQLLWEPSGERVHFL